MSSLQPKDGLTKHCASLRPSSYPTRKFVPDYNVNLTARHVNKRMGVMSYHYAVCKGSQLCSAVQDAYDGRRPPAQQFISHGEYKKVWDDSFRAVNGRVPVGAELKQLEST
ncbi:MAG: hypothetical protein L6R38_001216 [Xanthoria sp. 2 TBL-2021]|nr:MAG: hypothetical protein L6R38_001216 [Xanthoria sp. 2 TBL-2021]